MKDCGTTKDPSISLFLASANNLPMRLLAAGSLRAISDSRPPRLAHRQPRRVKRQSLPHSQPRRNAADGQRIVDRRVVFAVEDRGTRSVVSQEFRSEAGSLPSSPSDGTAKRGCPSVKKELLNAPPLFHCRNCRQSSSIPNLNPCIYLWATNCLSL